MDSHERDQFAEFDRQPYVDLTGWREQLVEYTEARLAVTEEEIRDHLGDTFSPKTHENIMNLVMSRLIRAHMEHIEPAVRIGDRLCVKGNIIYDIYTQSEHNFEAGWLEKGSELQGKFQSVSVREYLDESTLDTSPSQLTEAFVHSHIRHFGAHLLLSDPIEILPDGTVRLIPDCESLVIPLMYRRLKLTGYLAWDE